MPSAPALVIQTAFLGDVVLSTPLLEALARRHGPVDVVTTPAAAPLLETHPAVRHVIPYAKRGADRGLGGLLRVARRLRAAGYGIAYLPHRSLRSAALARLAAIPERIGFTDGWPLLYTAARERPNTGHQIDRLLALAGEAAPHQTQPSLGVTATDHAAAGHLLRAADIAPPFVALAPGSIWGTKRWPGYAGTGTRPWPAARGSWWSAARRTPAWVTTSSGRWGARAGGRSARAADSACARAPRSCRAPRVLVTNDSAPLHVAAAVGTPIVAIFGPTVPAFGFAPRGPRDAVVEHPDLPCRPCSAHGPRTCPLGHHRCMKEIAVDQVLHAIEETGALRHRD